MRIAFVLTGILLLVALASAKANPHPYGEEEEGGRTGSQTLEALKKFFRPVTVYFQGLHSKTPSDVADDVKDKVTDIKSWAKENEAIQALLSAMNPVKDWVKEKSTALSDTTFREMYDDLKERVDNLDESIAKWIDTRNQKSL